MPSWPFQLKPQTIIAPPTHDLEARANTAYFARRWDEAERLFREVLARADREGQQVARNMLGTICERQRRVSEAITFYEANVTERSSFGHPYKRLAIMYWRLGQPTDEERILRAAMHVLQGPGRQWYIDRLAKHMKS